MKKNFEKNTNIKCPVRKNDFFPIKFFKFKDRDDQFSLYNILLPFVRYAIISHERAKLAVNSFHLSIDGLEESFEEGKALETAINELIEITATCKKSLDESTPPNQICVRFIEDGSKVLVVHCVR